LICITCYLAHRCKDGYGGRDGDAIGRLGAAVLRAVGRDDREKAGDHVVLVVDVGCELVSTGDG